MNPEFQYPKTEEEFNKRAADITVQGARAVIKALESRRQKAVEKIDQEIQFYQRVIEVKS